MTKEPFVYAHEKEEEIIWMSQNTNQIETTPLIQEKIKEAVDKRKYNLYPYKKGILGLKELVLDDLNLKEGFDCMITNGGVEATYTLTRALLEEGDEVIASDPSFMPIHHQIELSGAKTVELDVYKEPYRMKPEDVREAVNENTKMILLIDPLNPLGSSYTREEVKEISEIAKENDLWLVDDVTYRDFAYDHTLTTEFYPEKTLLVYSFSKNCGFAGMRLGALVMPEQYSEKLHKWRTNVLSANVLAQVGAKTALETKDEWLDRMVSISRRNQEHIKEAVEKIDGLFLPVFPSSTNMFVIDVHETGLDPQEIQEKLLYEHDIFVRGGNYLSQRSGHKFIRVSFTVPEPEAKEFADKLPVVIDEMR